MVPLELVDIQGNILRGYNAKRGIHLFFTVTDAKKARDCLAWLADLVRDADEWKRKDKPSLAVNVALTYGGLAALEVDGDVLRALPDEFIDPVTRRADEALGDKVDKWWSKPYLDDAHLQHVLVLINALRPDPAQTDPRAEYRRLDAALLRKSGSAGDKTLGPLRELAARVRKVAEGSGLALAHEEYVEALADQREHFGFADGFGQPAVEGAPGPKRAGQGVPPSGDGALWRDLKAGEFIHGYPDEDGYVVSNEAASLLRNGSFMVYRKLEQDVAAFKRALDREATRYHDWTGSPASRAMVREQVAAKLAGRWRDGVSVELRPWREEKDDPSKFATSAAAAPSNDFTYARDRDGFRCPVGAHVRRTNPRDDDGRGGQLSKRHRIIRRSMPYTDHAAKTRGLIFICFNASIKRQFETVQKQWCMDGNAFGLGHDQDWLLSTGEGTGKATIQGAPPYFADASHRLVTPRGCQYLLMPGIHALRGIAARLW